MLAQLHSIKGRTYQDVWDFQTILHDNVKYHKMSPATKSKNKPYIINHIVFCEHLPVYTLGKSAKAGNLIANTEHLIKNGFEVYKVNRGGDITYHGPGQLTGYFVFDLELLYRDVHLYVRNLEQVVINVLKSYGLIGERLKDFTGVWIKDTLSKKYKKICAIGVHLSRWVSMHGIGFNVNTELAHFNNIIPCGIADPEKEVTSLEKELGRTLPLQEVEDKLLQEMCKVFEIKIVNPKS